jgi:hypothetical protein
VKGFILSLLPELGTMGSQWGGVRATGSSTSFFYTFKGLSQKTENKGFCCISEEGLISVRYAPNE